jgi:hypothetical protein
MKDYIYWSLRQLYLLSFWPSRFEREVESIATVLPRLQRRERFRYLLRMLPWIVTMAVAANTIAGYGCEAIGIVFNWRESWLGVLGGVLLGVGGGVVVRVALGVAGGIALSAALGVHIGVLGGVGTGIAFTMVSRLASGAATVNVLSALVTSVVIGLAFGAASGVVISTSGSMADGMMEGTWTALLVATLLGLELGVAYDPIGGAVGGAMVLVGFCLLYFRLATYPFDVALSFFTYVAARWRPRAVVPAWRCCPVAWSETISLPLPFVGRLLALLVERDREEGFRQIKFVSAERRSQRGAARYALTELAISDLQVRPLSEIADVTEKLGWMTDSPTALSAQLTAALRRFDRAAHYVGQYLTLHSAYLKRDALEHARLELGALQRNLITARGHFAPRLLQAVNQWESVLEVEQRTIRHLAEARDIPNPFVFGNPVAETKNNVFTGRRDIVRQIEGYVLRAAQTPLLLLHGARRMGKTSILNQLPRLLGPDFAPAIIDCQNPAVTERPAFLLRHLSRALVDSLRQRGIHLEALPGPELSLWPFDTFDEWLKRLDYVTPKNMRVLVCLDEYERLQTALNAEWREVLLDALRHWLQHRTRLALMFSGTHTLQQLGPAWTVRFSSARHVRVSFLTRDEVLPLLTKPILEFDMTYAPETLDVIFAATNGQPFLTQAVAFELVQFLNEERRREATPTDVENAITRALVSAGAYFANAWSDSGEPSQAILRAIASGLTPPDFAPGIAWLQEHDVLEAAGGFAVPMFRRWVRDIILNDSHSVIQP